MAWFSRAPQTVKGAPPDSPSQQTRGGSECFASQTCTGLSPFCSCTPRHTRAVSASAEAIGGPANKIGMISTVCDCFCLSRLQHAVPPPTGAEPEHRPLCLSSARLSRTWVSVYLHDFDYQESCHVTWRTIDGREAQQQQWCLFFSKSREGEIGQRTFPSSRNLSACERTAYRQTCCRVSSFLLHNVPVAFE